VSGEYIHGLHAVLAALRASPQRVDALWLDAGRGDERMAAIVRAALTARIKFHRVPRERLDRLAEGAAHQGAVARLRAMPARGENDLAGFLSDQTGVPFLLVLDGVQDPHNLGSCLRTAEAAGVQAVIVPRDNAASLTATVHKVASGAAGRVPVFQVTNLVRALGKLKDAGLWLVGASADAVQSLYDTDLRGPVALVLGGEGRGLRRLTRERCDVLASLPLQGEAQSLNVAVAAGVCLYEALRQRRAGPTG
jgi:23S rRNA (guanosine2251-2'-O)-methyltransferase